MFDLEVPMNKVLPRRIKHPTGELGVEIEWEGRLNPWSSEISIYWDNKEDGSLRNGREYVLKKPLTMSEFPSAVDELRKLSKGSKAIYSNRTSVHIHFNISNYKLYQVLNILTFNYIVERMLIASQGPDRRGNLFCLGIHDAESILDSIDFSLRHEGYLVDFSQDHSKYSALNLSAISMYGSVEWRFLRGMTDLDEIQDWCLALGRAATIAANSLSPMNILNLYRYSDSEDFLKTFFEPKFLSKYIFSSVPNWRDLLKDNFSYAYELVKIINRAKTTPNYMKPYIKAQDEDLDPGDYDGPKINTLSLKPKPSYIIDELATLETDPPLFVDDPEPTNW